MKNKQIFAVLGLLFVALWACGKKQAAEPQKEMVAEQKEAAPMLIVATDATWPPMEFINEQKEIVGFDIDVLNAMAQDADFMVEVRNAAWDGIFAGLLSGSYDAVISAVTITEERKKTMDFTEPYINAGQVVIVQQSNDSVASVEDLTGLEVGAQIGTTGAITISKMSGVKLKNYDELGLAIEDLANGRLGAVVADTPIAADYALNNVKYKDTLKIVGEPFTEEYYGIAVKKGRQEIVELLNKGLQKIKASGELDRLRRKWLE